MSNNDLYVGDIGQQGHSYRILVHHPDDPNKLVYINPNGENTTVILNDLEDAQQYATGNHPANKYNAPITKIGSLNALLPVISNTNLYRELGAEIMKKFSYEITKVGPDKNLHFLANIALTELSDCKSEDELGRGLERLFEAIKISIIKEMDQVGIGKDDRDRIDMLDIIDDLKENSIKLNVIINKCKLDKGDMYADFIGMYLGSALMMLYQLDYEFNND